jgi:hypothetical protein
MKFGDGLFTSCLEEEFPETGLPINPVLGNSEVQRAQKSQYSKTLALSS